MSFAYRPDGPSWFEAVDGFRARPFRFGPAGALIADQRGPDGGRMICFPTTGLVAIESRLGALLAGDVGNHDLMPADSLTAGADRARELLSSHVGVDVGGAEVRRLDTASELRFGTGSDGAAFLKTVASMCPPRLVADVWRAVDGSVMTVYFRTAKRGAVVARVYDKGRESGSDPPGMRVRIEDQYRPPKAKRQSPEVLSTSDLTARFGRTMNPYLEAETITVAGPDGAVAELAAQAVRGEISHARAERLIGSVALLKYGGRAVYDRCDDTRKTNDKRSSSRLRALRDAGVVLSDELPADATVPVSELLREAVARFSA